MSDGAVKMAIVYNLGKFVDWPIDPAIEAPGQLTLCMLGPSDRFQEGLAAIESKPVRGKELRIRRLAYGSELAGCQILFIADAGPERLGSVLATAHALNMLSISDADHFAERGGAIGLLVRDNHVRFAVNLDAARAANIRISSELLRLALSVTGAQHP